MSVRVFNKRLWLSLILPMALLLSGCSDDEPSTTTSAPKSQSAMDVKQPQPSANPMQPLQSSPAPKSSSSLEPAKAKASDELKAEVAQLSGQDEYATCVGCHGPLGEGGVGPRLNNQEVSVLVAKLQMYKEGGQVGPLTSMMIPMVRNMSTAQMQAVAEYVTQSKP